MTDASKELLPCLDAATPEQIERANIAVEANLIDGQPKFDSAQGYACALTAIMQSDARAQRAGDYAELVKRVQDRIAAAETHPPGGSRERVSELTIRAVLDAAGVPALERENADLKLDLDRYIHLANIECDLAEELQRRLAEVEKALGTIHDRFARDIEQGYVTKDKTYAVEIARNALNGETGKTPSASAPGTPR